MDREAVLQVIEHFSAYGAVVGIDQHTHVEFVEDLTDGKGPKPHRISDAMDVQIRLKPHDFGNMVARLNALSTVELGAERWKVGQVATSAEVVNGQFVNTSELTMFREAY